MPDLSSSLPSHAYIEAKGRGKLHGLVVFYRRHDFFVRAQKTIYLDEEALSNNMDPSEITTAATERTRRGGSRQTKNVGLIAALANTAGWGIIVLTTHL